MQADLYLPRPNILVWAATKTISLQECREKFIGRPFNVDKIYPNNICTFNIVSGGDVCYGDVGAPLITKETNTLVGIASYTVQGYPDVFERISSHLEFINNNLNSTF